MRILFVAVPVGGQFAGAGRLAPFQQADVDLLRGLGHTVSLLLWEGHPIGRALRESRRADLVYCWGIGEHSLWTSWRARRFASVIGGYEFANLPEFGYGNLIRWRSRWFSRRVWARADALLYVDPSLQAEAAAAFGHAGHARYLPTGYDASWWSPGTGPRENLAVTVCHAPSMNRWRLKGVDLFLEVARANPDVQFVVAGEVPRDIPEDSVPSNVRLTGWIEQAELRALFQRAAAYCQFSFHEGLPNAVCEAMLCGCVPIGTRVNGIPTAIGDAGFLVDRGVPAVSHALRQALTDPGLGLRARDRISRMFPIDRRRDELRGILEELLRGTSSG